MPVRGLDWAQQEPPDALESTSPLLGGIRGGACGIDAFDKKPSTTNQPSNHEKKLNLSHAFKQDQTAGSLPFLLPMHHDLLRILFPLSSGAWRAHSNPKVPMQGPVVPAQNVFHPAFPHIADCPSRLPHGGEGPRPYDRKYEPGCRRPYPEGQARCGQISVRVGTPIIRLS